MKCLKTELSTPMLSPQQSTVILIMGAGPGKNNHTPPSFGQMYVSDLLMF